MKSSALRCPGPRATPTHSPDAGGHQQHKGEDPVVPSSGTWPAPFASTVAMRRAGGTQARPRPLPATPRVSAEGSWQRPRRQGSAQVAGCSAAAATPRACPLWSPPRPGAPGRENCGSSLQLVCLPVTPLRSSRLTVRPPGLSLRPGAQCKRYVPRLTSVPVLGSCAQGWQDVSVGPKG